MSAIIAFLTPSKIKLAVIAGLRLTLALIEHLELALKSDYAGALAPVLHRILAAARLIANLLQVVAGFVGAKGSTELGAHNGTTLDNAMRDLERLLK